MVNTKLAMSEGGISPEEMGLTQEDMQTTAEAITLPPEEQLFQEIMALPGHDRYTPIRGNNATFKIRDFLVQHPELPRDEAITRWLEVNRIGFAASMGIRRMGKNRDKDIKGGVLRSVLNYAGAFPDKFGGSEKVIREASDYAAILSGRRTIIDRTGRRAFSRHLDGGTVGKLVDKLTTRSTYPRR